MDEESVFLDYVGDSPRMRVLQFLIEGRGFDYTLTDMLTAGVSWATINSLIPSFAKLGVVVKTRKVGRATLYKLNRENLFVKRMISLYNNLLLEELRSAKRRAIVSETT